MENNTNLEMEEVKKLTILERIKYFFINPNKLFEDYNTKPAWLVKFLIIVGLTVIYIIIFKNVTIDPQMDLRMQMSPDMTKEQAEAAMAFANSPWMTALYVIFAIAGAAISAFLIPLIYYGLIALFGGKTKYMKVVSVYLLAYIPYMIGTLVGLAFAYYTNNYESLLQPTVTDVLLNRLDLFVIWQALLLVFGFSKVADLKLHKSAIIVSIMWLIATGIALVPVYMNRMF